MKIQTGQGTIPLITLIGIFSISALNALPGLAVSPILGDLNKIFPSATDLEIQMLSSLPSLLIIPFILLSGKLTEKVNNLLLLQVGLTIFGVSRQTHLGFCVPLTEITMKTRLTFATKLLMFSKAVREAAKSSS